VTPPPQLQAHPDAPGPAAQTARRTCRRSATRRSWTRCRARRWRPCWRSAWAAARARPRSTAACWRAPISWPGSSGGAARPGPGRHARARAQLSVHSSVFSCCKGPGAGEGGRPCALGLPAQAGSVRRLGGGRVSGAAGCAHACPAGRVSHSEDPGGRHALCQRAPARIGPEAGRRPRRARAPQAAAWADAARERGQGPDVAGRPDVEMVEAFSGLERHLEAALAAARAPAAPPEARPCAFGGSPPGSGARPARCLRGGFSCGRSD